MSAYNSQVVGPMANNSYGIFGGYAPDPDPRYIITPLEGLKQISAETRFSPGCKDSDTACEDYNPTDIGKAVNGTELVVVCLGTGIFSVKLYPQTAAAYLFRQFIWKCTCTWSVNGIRILNKKHSQISQIFCFRNVEVLSHISEKLQNSYRNAVILY
jgi:hypothetical protein